MKSKRISINIPSQTFLNNSTVSNLRDFLTTFFMDTYRGVSSGISSRRSFSGLGKRMPKFKMDWKKAIRVAVPVVGVVVLGFVVWSVFARNSDSENVKGVKVDVPESLIKQEINKTYNFPVSNGDEELTNFEYTIESAELRNQIIVKGQRATAVEGRVFLIVNLSLVNDFDKALSINTRDYIRVVLDGKKEVLLAPDIHNDPVEVQAISTKHTRLGLAIDSDVKSIALQVGEIEGEKETIKLDLVE